MATEEKTASFTRPGDSCQLRIDLLNLHKEKDIEREEKKGKEKERKETKLRSLPVFFLFE